MISTITSAVTASVAQRIASFCSPGISMIPIAAIAGKNTIVESKNSGLIKIKTPNLKHQAPNKFQSPNPDETNKLLWLVPFEFGSSNLFVIWSLVLGLPALAGQRRAPEKADQQENPHGPDHDKHYVLPNPTGLNRMQADAQRIGPRGQQIHETIDKRAVGDRVPHPREPDTSPRGPVQKAVDPPLIDAGDHPRDDHRRLHENRVVQFVEPPLVDQQVIDGRELPPHVVRIERAPPEERRGKQDAAGP